jgi:hypothetical protein
VRQDYISSVEPDAGAGADNFDIRAYYLANQISNFEGGGNGLGHVHCCLV